MYSKQDPCCFFDYSQETEEITNGVLLTNVCLKPGSVSKKKKDTQTSRIYIYNFFFCKVQRSNFDSTIISLFFFSFIPLNEYQKKTTVEKRTQKKRVLIIHQRRCHRRHHPTKIGLVKKEFMKMENKKY